MPAATRTIRRSAAPPAAQPKPAPAPGGNAVGGRETADGEHDGREVLAVRPEGVHEDVRARGKGDVAQLDGRGVGVGTRVDVRVGGGSHVENALVAVRQRARELGAVGEDAHRADVGRVTDGDEAVADLARRQLVLEDRDGEVTGRLGRVRHDRVRDTGLERQVVVEQLRVVGRVRDDDVVVARCEAAEGVHAHVGARETGACRDAGADVVERDGARGDVDVDRRAREGVDDVHVGRLIGHGVRRGRKADGGEGGCTQASENSIAHGSSLICASRGINPARLSAEVPSLITSSGGRRTDAPQPGNPLRTRAQVRIAE